VELHRDRKYTVPIRSGGGGGGGDKGDGDDDGDDDDDEEEKGVDPYDTDQTDSPTADDVLPPRDVVKKWEQALLKKTMGYNQICI
jgi:hypothetical protein